VKQLWLASVAQSSDRLNTRAIPAMSRCMPWIARARVPPIGLQGERDFSATRAHAPALDPPGPPLLSRTRAEVRIDMTASAPRAV